MVNCIYEKEFIINGLTQSYGIEHNCNFNSNNEILCYKCLKYAREKTFL